DPSKKFRCDALVDTGTTYMVLPNAWKDRLGELELIETTEFSTATKPIEGEIRGPVEIRLEGFRRVHTDVVFVEMEAEEDPLVGYVVLEQCHAAVDMLGHRLIHVKRMDLK
ncbi:MAG: hypothetical protein GY856_40800, partial [bacterium]|nr:hypothetical protein [bacterium]